MGNFYFIGIDISKNKLDICVRYQGKVIKEMVISNHDQSIKKRYRV
ncbi:MAG: hypothetical protein LUG51_16295 [Tannerellaceae bacterium]|nr:hypothetical protein [Tannerellaceae bacterium]